MCEEKAAHEIRLDCRNYRYRCGYAIAGARQGSLRHQLGRGGRARRFLSGARRRHIQKSGLDVTIVPGGPNINNRILLPVGKLDFFMSANSLQSFDAVTQNIPTVAVAASFQKDPQIFVTHPGITKFEDLKTRTLFVSKEGMTTYFQWLKSDFGFSKSKVKPYTLNTGSAAH